MVDYRLLGTHRSMLVVGVGTCRLVDQHMGMDNHGKLGPSVRGQASWNCLDHIPLLRRWDGLQLLIGSCWMDGNDCSTTRWTGGSR